MAEYIDREAAKKMHCDICMEKSVCYRDKESCPERRAFDRIPAADVRPVVRGKWIISRTDYGWNSAEFPTHCKCDQCGREIPYLDRDDYCPNCGADMREAKDEE